MNQHTVNHYSQQQQQKFNFMKTLKKSILAILLMTFCLSTWAQNNSVKIDANSNIGKEGVFIGASAGDAVNVNDQTDNTYIGHEAGRSNTEDRNTYVGSNAGSEGTIGTYNTFIGYNSGKNSNSYNNVFIGAQSGMNNTTAGLNVLIGRAAGKNINEEGCTMVGTFSGESALGASNTLIGYVSGRDIQGGTKNAFLGAQSGRFLVGGDENTFLGTRTGFEMTAGNRNTIIGVDAAQHKAQGDRNVYLGFESGWENFNGSGNVFIGTQSGKYVTGNNQLYIENTDTLTAPLIYGDFENDKVGINTNDVPDDYALGVRGKIIAEEIRLKLYADGWPDYVFEPEYNMLTLEETEQQIETLGHLPGVPSATEVGTDGIQVGEMNAILLEKIEELTLHMIDMNKEVKALRDENQTLKNRMDKMIND